MSNKKCCVPGCEDDTSVRHRFPKNDKQRMEIWLRRVANPTLDKDFERIYKTYRICKRHFSDDCYSPGRAQLNANALPTLNVPGYENSCNVKHIPKQGQSMERSAELLLGHDSDGNVNSNCEILFHPNNEPRSKRLRTDELNGTETLVDEIVTLPSRIIGNLSAVVMRETDNISRKVGDSPKGRNRVPSVSEFEGDEVEYSEHLDEPHSIKQKTRATFDDDNSTTYTLLLEEDYDDVNGINPELGIIGNVEFIAEKYEDSNVIEMEGNKSINKVRYPHERNKMKPLQSTTRDNSKESFPETNSKSKIISRITTQDWEDDNLNGLASTPIRLINSNGPKIENRNNRVYKESLTTRKTYINKDTNEFTIEKVEEDCPATEMQERRTELLNKVSDDNVSEDSDSDTKRPIPIDDELKKLLLKSILETRSCIAKKCSVPGCTDTKSMRHRFPKNDGIRLQLWLDKISSPTLHNLSLDKLYRSHRICRNHFTDDCYSPGRKRLNGNAVPSLNLPGNAR